MTALITQVDNQGERDAPPYKSASRSDMIKLEEGVVDGGGQEEKRGASPTLTSGHSMQRFYRRFKKGK